MRTLHLGDVMEVPVGSAHVHPHTDAATTAVVEHTIEPRPRFVSVFFASYPTWLAEGRVDAQDEPTLLQVMAILRVGGGGTSVGGPPVAVQKGPRLGARSLRRRARDPAGDPADA